MHMQLAQGLKHAARGRRKDTWHRAQGTDLVKRDSLSEPLSTVSSELTLQHSRLHFVRLAARRLLRWLFWHGRWAQEPECDGVAH